MKAFGQVHFYCLAWRIILERLKGEEKSKRKSVVSTNALIGVFSASIAGTLVFLNQIPNTVWWRPEALFWWSVPLFSLHFLTLTLLFIRAHWKQDQDAQQFWLVHLLGLSLLPVTSAVSFLLTKGLLQGDIGTAWYGAAVGGWSLATFTGSLTNIFLTTYDRDAITSKKFYLKY